MDRRVTALFMIVCMILSSVCISGCSDLESQTKTEEVFRFAVDHVPTSLDPTKCNSIVDNEIQHAVTEGLTRTTGGVISPGIAESWDVSKDGRTYVFHLREAKWSDGQPVTAGDFVYSWRRLADPEIRSAYAFAVWMIEGGREVNIEGADPETLGIRAVDDRTLEVRLENPTAYFLGYIGSQAQFAPLRKDIVEKAGGSFALSAEDNVYSGPFVLESVSGNEWHFSKNPEYWDADSINIDRAEMHYYGDVNEKISSFENGGLDFAVLPNDKAAEMKHKGNVNHFLNGVVDFCHINPNKNKVLANRHLRLALNYALDRVEYNHDSNNNVYKPYNALVFPGLTGKDGVTYGEAYDVDSYAYPLEGDVDRAQYHLKAALKELGISKAEDITIELLATASAEDAAIAEELKTQWSEVLGINFTIRKTTHTDLYTKDLPRGRYEIACAGWGPDYNDPYTFLELFRSDNTSYNPYSNPEYDKLLDASIAETDLSKRMDLLNDAEKMLISDGAFIPLQAKDIYYLLDPAVSNLTLSFSNITLDWVHADINRKSIYDHEI